MTIEDCNLMQYYIADEMNERHIADEMNERRNYENSEMNMIMCYDDFVIYCRMYDEMPIIE